MKNQINIILYLLIIVKIYDLNNSENYYCYKEWDNNYLCFHYIIKIKKNRLIELSSDGIRIWNFPKPLLLKKINFPMLLNDIIQNGSFNFGLWNKKYIFFS